MSQYLVNSKRFRWGPDTAVLNPDKAKLLKEYAIGSVIDVGCGSGIYTDFLFNLGHNVVGLDAQQEFIKKAQTKYPPIKFIKGDAHKIPFPENSFDTIVLFDIIEHLDDRKVINEALRVGKRLIISIPRQNQEILTQYALSHAHYLDQTHKRVYTETSLRDLLLKLKLKIIYLQPALPLSISGLLINHLSRGSALLKFILKVILKPFLPEPPICSTIFAVVDKT